MSNVATDTAFQVNLPARLEDASVFTDTPFPIFEFDNFVPDPFYKALVADVQQRNEFDLVFAAGEKKKFSLGGHNIDAFEDSPLKTFVSYFLRQDFFDWFVRTHLPYFPSEGEVERVLVHDRPGTKVQALKRAAIEEGKARTFYTIEVHYSSIETGGFIPPHTDFHKKRLSLVYYLPEEPLPEDMQIGLGTIFYGPKPGQAAWSDFSSGLLNPRKSAQFLDQHDVAQIALFQPNKCVGFIKSDISWHAVARNVFDYDRRAIVINILEL